MSTKTTPRRQSVTQIVYEYIFVAAQPTEGSALPVIAFDA